MYKCKHCRKEFEKRQSLAGHIRFCDSNPLHEQNLQEHKIKSGKAWKGRTHTEETKRKISKARRKYLQENPDQVPYRLYHKSKGMSWPEKRLANVLKKSDLKWIYDMQEGLYNLDFAFPEYKLDVEVDGSTHDLPEVKAKDERRDKVLAEKGWRTLRIPAKDVNENPYHVFNKIVEELGLMDKIMDIPEELLNKHLNKKLKALNSRKQTNKISNTSEMKTGRESNIQDEKKKDRLVFRQDRKDKLLNSGIDFSKKGWVKQAATLIGITPPKISKWIRKHMPEFYEKECFSESKRANLNEEMKHKVLKSDINFSKKGWQKEVCELLGMTDGVLSYWFKENLPEIHAVAYYAKPSKQQLEKINKERKRIVHECDIDFSDKGWSSKLGILLGIDRTSAYGWMKRNMPNFYDKECYKRKNTK